MASIRRSLSPAKHERQLKSTQRPAANASHLSSSSSSFSSTASISSHPWRWMLKSPIFFEKQPRKWPQPWRRSLIGFLSFFAVGFLLGVFPYSGSEERARLRAREFVEPDHYLDNGGSEISMKRQIDGVVLNRLEFEERKERSTDYFDKSSILPREQLIVVTPTYNRPLQAYYLIRLGQTLRLVPSPLLWIVVEMSSVSMETAKLLQRTGVMYRHLACVSNSTKLKDRGVHQRNAALEHIERHRLDGIVYFADDDNIYSLELFKRLRDVRRFGTWPVAMLAQSKSKVMLEGPVCNGSEVIGWHTNEKSKRLRRFHVDMSGFAFNSTILWDPKRWNRPSFAPIRQLDTVREGFQETSFIEQIVGDESNMEGLPEGCSKIMNWHLHLESKFLSYPSGWIVTKNLDAIFPLH